MLKKSKVAKNLKVAEQFVAKPTVVWVYLRTKSNAIIVCMTAWVAISINIKS